MPGSIRPNKKGMKIAYKILGTPKDQQQKNKKPSNKLIYGWIRESINSQ